MKARKVRAYDKEFKLNAIHLYLRGESSYKEMSKELGVPETTLIGWVYSHKKNGKESFPGKGSIKPSEVEIHQLRKRLAIAEQERDILKKAVAHRKPDRGLMHHSDKGCQYTSKKFNQLLGKYGMIASQSGTGNCYDNAAMESFFHTLKTEHIYFENYQTREQAKQSIFEYVEIFYNRKRRHSTLGYLSPADFEKHWQQQQVFPLLSV
jgi:transposase-like protein